jgi:hypothetical protein
MRVGIPRQHKWINYIRDWWKYRNAVLTISINDDGVVILEGVVNQRVRADCTVGIGKDLLLRKELSVRALRDGGGGTWTGEDFSMTTSGSFEDERGG